VLILQWHRKEEINMNRINYKSALRTFTIALIVASSVIAGLTHLGHARVQAQVDSVQTMRLEQVEGQQSWTLIFEMSDGSQRECRTIEAFVVAAEPKEIR
jgi:hypothetical protein